MESYDRKHRFAIYTLRVSNHLKTPLFCRIWVISHDGAAQSAHQTIIEIAPLSERSTDVPIWMDDCNSFERALAEIVGEGVECIVEAAAPQTETVAALPAAAEIARDGRFAIAGVALAAIVVAAVVFSMAVPRIAAFAAPPMALNGTTVRAEYSASGAGKIAYAVLAPDGHTVQSGPLKDYEGAIPIAIPPSSVNGAFTLQLTMRGPLGSAKEIRVLNTVPRANDAAQISDISVDPPVAKPGQTVTVTYAAAGTDGYVRLLGTDGTIWGQQPFLRSGKASFVVPALNDSREMHVLLHVTKGQSVAQSTAGLVVAGAPAPAPRPA
ncbi:MAG TPA: hypothetical protein VFU90_13435, partial [Candidatus Tumulicola sp.]|nr:hypothetical protein [Candidatus Tumulicola sp.]